MDELRRIPAITKLGLLVMVGAGVLDVVVHVAADAHAAHAHAAFGVEHLAHLLGMAGMALVLIGVVIHGARRQLRQRAVAHGGLDTNAHR